MDLGIPLLDDITSRPGAGGGGGGGLDPVLINYGGAAGTYIATGNWNHVFQNFASGLIPITGNDVGESLASLRTTAGVLTGWKVSNPGLFGGETSGEDAGGGIYATSAIKDCWTVPATVRSTTIIDMNPAKTYRFKILMSVDTAVEATSLGDIVVSGASGGITVSAFDERGNVSNLVGGVNGFTVVPTAGGVVTIAMTINTGHCSISVLEIQEL